MSAQAAVCPRCGARQSGTKAADAESDIDRQLRARRASGVRPDRSAEARAIIASTPLPDHRASTPMGYLREAFTLRSRGPLRIVEGLLSLIALPLLVAGVFSAFMASLSYRGQYEGPGFGPLAAAVATATLAASLFWSAESATLKGLIVVMLMAAVLRALMRWR